MVSARALVASGLLVLLPLLLVLVVVIAFDGNVFALLGLFTWLGLGVTFGAIGATEG